MGQDNIPNRTGTAVIAVGGNALIVDPTKKSIHHQYEAARHTAAHLVGLLIDGWRVVLTHGNGPQVGFILRRSELSSAELPMVPMDYAGADIQGAVGYMFLNALNNELAERNLTLPVASVVTRVSVDPHDPAFLNPTKPIGSHMDRLTAEKHVAELNWQLIEDSGRGWRRVVPSPQPQEIIDINSIRQLSETGYTVIACGGGGIPVRKNSENRLEGVEAVIDKDFASSLLARELNADVFIIVTAVPRVAINFNTPQQQFLEKMTVSEARSYLEAGHFGKGSMAPKVQAIMDYVDATGRPGIITDIEHLQGAIKGSEGTRIYPTTKEQGHEILG